MHYLQLKISLKKKHKRTPPPPFITSTLQQEIGKRLSISSKQIMSIAQSLYENGHITYHRTDSVILSNDIKEAINGYIIDNYGKEYSEPRDFKSKSINAQEAHEAIRPTSTNTDTLDNGTNQEKKVYELIWKRTIASQMSPEEVEISTMKIDISGRDEKFIAKAEKVLFEGYKILYNKDNSNDTNTKLVSFNDFKCGTLLIYNKIISTEKYTKAATRYSEATLIKKLEELGIGRPSTYASVINIVQDRGYVIKENRKGKEILYEIITLDKNKKITENKKKTYMENEKNKLFPTDIGNVVNKYLNDNFTNILEYNFTANVEKELDKIANGNLIWNKVVKNMYDTFHPTVEKLSKNSGNKLVDKGKKIGWN